MKRAIISIKGNPRKNILLFIAMVALGSMMSGSIFVNQIIGNTRENIIGTMQAKAMIGLDFAGAEAFEIDLVANSNAGELISFSERPQLTPEIIHQIGSLSYVRSYEYFANGIFFSPTLEEYNPDIDEHYWIDPGTFALMNAGSDLLPLFEIRGVESSNFLDIEQGIIEIVAGRTFSNEEIEHLSAVALVSEDFARINQLAVGSTIQLTNAVFHPFEVDFAPGWMRMENTLWAETYDVAVIGIYNSLLSIPSPFFSMQENLHLMAQFSNRIYMPNNFIEMSKERSADIALAFALDDMITGDSMVDASRFYATVMSRNMARTQYETFFTLYSPQDIIAFQNAALDLLPDFYNIDFSEHSFHEIIAALDIMDSLAIATFLITGIAMVLLLSLLLTLFLRDRKQEMGIYFSLGEKKIKIITQIVFEVLIIFILAFLTALFIGNILAGQLTENMLLNNLLTDLENNQMQNRGWDLFFRAGLYDGETVIDIRDSYDLSFAPTALLIFLGVSFGTVLLAVVVPLLYLLRLSPKKIMM